MEIFIIIIVFLIIWFFTSTSKSKDVKTAIKFAKEAKDGTNKFLDETNKFLDELSNNLDKFSSELEEKNIEKFKNRLYELSEREGIENLNELNKSLGLTDNFDEVTWMVDAFKRAGRYDEISHLVIKKNDVKSGFFSSNEEKYFINREYGELRREKATRDKLAQDKLAQDKLAQDKLAQDKLAQDKLAQDKLAQDKLAQDKLAQDKLAKDKLAQDKLAQDKLAQDKLAQDKLAKDKLAKDKLAKDKLAKDKLAKDKLAKASNDTASIEDINKYAGEVDSYLIDFLKIRFYLAGKRGYPDLQCVDQYFNSKFSDLDKSSYSSIWQNIVSATVFDSSKCKDIDAIYHFTHKSNLSSILEYGILTRTNLNNMNLRYAFNDQMRLDGVLDSISLSFSHPNFKMFYKYRKQTSDDDWVVLKISPSLIYGKEPQTSNRTEHLNYLNKAVFCNTNAASNKMRNLSIEERMTCNAFLDMFESPIGRALPTYTYDNQAEILYLGDIPVDFIEEIYTNHQDESLNWVRELGYKVTENDVVFDQRRYRDG
nr:DarT ssDNA thymidine ADP-ribosyltransferase family protein [Psychrobacter sp. CMS30]